MEVGWISVLSSHTIYNTDMTKVLEMAKSLKVSPQELQNILFAHANWQLFIDGNIAQKKKKLLFKMNLTSDIFVETSGLFHSKMSNKMSTTAFHHSERSIKWEAEVELSQGRPHFCLSLPGQLTSGTLTFSSITASELLLSHPFSVRFLFFFILKVWNKLMYCC